MIKPLCCSGCLLIIDPFKALLADGVCGQDQLLKDMIIRALQEFFVEYTACNGRRQSELQNAMDVVLATIVSKDIGKNRLGLVLRSIFNLNGRCLKRAFIQREQLKDRKG